MSENHFVKLHHKYQKTGVRVISASFRRVYLVENPRISHMHNTRGNLVDPRIREFSRLFHTDSTCRARWVMLFYRYPLVIYNGSNFCLQTMSEAKKSCLLLSQEKLILPMLVIFCLHNCSMIDHEVKFISPLCIFLVKKLLILFFVFSILL